MDFTETTIDTREIYKGRIIHIKEDTVRLPNGEIAGRELVLHNGGVAVVAIDKDNNVLMVRQYRKPYEEMVLEIPAG
ncbi:MAG TPA: ADP-ribose pyrophosphatase, partial [Clostridiales bacterium]|nr:ADP-ribose pyrophosphatase [Clostridiales bacterium]